MADEAQQPESENGQAPERGFMLPPFLNVGKMGINFEVADFPKADENGVPTGEVFTALRISCTAGTFVFLMKPQYADQMGDALKERGRRPSSRLLIAGAIPGLTRT